LCGWGDNNAGALGVDGVANNTFSSGPVAVDGLTDVIAVAGSGQFEASSAFTFALRRDGTVWAWGSGINGQLGNGSKLSSRVPVPVSGLTNVVAIAAGDQTGYALRTDGTVWAWGSGSAGQLGNHQQCTTSAVPVQVQGLSGVKAIAAGGVTAYALRADGHVVAWGSNSRGAIGNGETSQFRNQYPDCTIPDQHDVLSPVPVSGLSDVVALAGGLGNGYALRKDGTVWAWGSGGFGALGNGDTTEADGLTPVQVKGLPQIQTVVGSSAGYTAYALDSGGTVWAWGFDGQGNLGNSAPCSVQPTTFSAVPVQVANLSGMTSIGAGADNGYARKRDGTVWAWGSAYAGSLGNGDANATDTSIPMQVANVSGATAVFGGYANGFGIGGIGGARPPPTPSTLKYIALGDSYSSGEAAPPFESQFGSCDRSTNAWPNLLARSEKNLKLLGNFACSGATTKALSQPFKGQLPELTQMLNTGSAPDVVTITIGGNDIDFSTVLARCVISDCSLDGTVTFTKDFTAALLPSKLAIAYAKIRRAAPHGRVIVVGYPRLFPTTQVATINCGWLTETERIKLNEIAIELDTTIKTAARHAGFDYVSTLNALDHHELCTDVSWIFPVGSSGGQLRGHPLLRGQEAIAAIVSQYFVTHRIA
jgi:alpha-tubulin suppressor-like RCC1 family protein/lysophospholipase L1-like esterase